MFSKKVQGQKHSGRWGIVEHQIPSIKVLFKTNNKGHKHPSIRLLSKSKTQLVNQRKQKVAFIPGTAHSPEMQSYRTWWGAASPILNDTPVVYTTYNRTRIRNVYIYIYIYIYINRASGRKPRSSGGNTSSISHVLALVPRPVVNGMERMCQRHGSDQTPTLLFESKNHVSIHLYNIIYAVEEFLSVIPNSVIVWSLQYNVFFATIDRCSVIPGMYRWSMMIKLIQFRDMLIMEHVVSSQEYTPRRHNLW